MQLFFIPDLTESQQHCILDREERNHLVKVLRKKSGDVLHFTNGKGLLATGEITQISNKDVKISLLSFEKQEKKGAELTIAIAPTKNNDRIEWFMEKATEIGIANIQLIICDQSERRVIKEERFERILQSATKQSLALFKPELLPLKSFEEFIRQNHSGDLFIAHCEDENDKTQLIQELKSNTNTTVLIGPEGDFSIREIELAKKMGFKAVSLGEKRLRTETAGLYATAVFAFKNA